MAYVEKDPNIKDQFGLDWSDRAPDPAEDPIVSSTWPTIPAGITKSASPPDGFDADTRVTWLWLEGGALKDGNRPKVYRCVNRITRQSGAQDEKTLRVLVREF